MTAEHPSRNRWRRVGLLLFLPLAFLSCARQVENGVSVCRSVGREFQLTPVDPANVPFCTECTRERPGLQSRIYTRTVEQYAGEPIEVFVEVTNTSETSKSLLSSQEVVFANGKFQVFDSSGNSVPCISHGYQHYPGVNDPRLKARALMVD
jgi:hypothetical protein